MNYDGPSVTANPRDIICLAYNKKTQMYCRRLRVICPEHGQFDKPNETTACAAPIHPNINDGMLVYFKHSSTRACTLGVQASCPYVYWLCAAATVRSWPCRRVVVRAKPVRHTTIGSMCAWAASINNVCTRSYEWRRSRRVRSAYNPCTYTSTEINKLNQSVRNRPNLIGLLLNQTEHLPV
jgi:hypothetical protein